MSGRTKGTKETNLKNQLRMNQFSYNTVVLDKMIQLVTKFKLYG